MLTHEYVLPAEAVAPMDREEPAQTLVFAIVAAIGNWKIEIITELEFEHPFEFVSVIV